MHLRLSCTNNNSEENSNLFDSTSQSCVTGLDVYYGAIEVYKFKLLKLQVFVFVSAAGAAAEMILRVYERYDNLQSNAVV